jgi:bifunctional N-acetylglucosamine-1-phosphate-uridyltransferase/glucosamine-1-phosphate-acetyltransferase GlmU-like protein
MLQVMSISLDLFFENLKEEKIAELFQNVLPWEPLKKLKDFLLEMIPELPKDIPIGLPLPESLILTENKEVIPLKECEICEEEYYFKGERLEGAVLQAGAVLTGRKIFFEKNIIVEPFSVISPPAYFSKGTQIRHGAYIRGSVYTGEKAVIGHTTEVKNSIFLSSAKAAHFAYIGDSILGKDVNLGAGTKLANLKFNKKNITLVINNEIINTGLKKLGAILGDKCQTGCNSVLQPGTLLGKESYVYPGKTCGPGYFPPGTKIK